MRTIIAWMLVWLSALFMVLAVSEASLELLFVSFCEIACAGFLFARGQDKQ